MNDGELEGLIFEGFAGGKTVNTIAKECEPLIQKIPDYKKRVQKVDNLKKKWKKGNAGGGGAPKVEVELKGEGGASVRLKGSFKPSASGDAKVVEVGLNFSSSLGREIYAQVQNNVMARAEYRDFMSGIFAVNREGLEETFSHLLETVKVLSEVNKNDSGKEARAMLQQALANFTSFFHAIKSPHWITPFSSETMAFGQVVAGEIQGMQNGIIAKQVRDSADEEPLIDMRRISFKSVL